MKTSRFILLAVIVFSIPGFTSCDDENDNTLLSSSLRFKVQRATFEGNAITPLPDYTLNISYDNSGTITGYTATNSNTFTPTPANSGMVTINDSMVTFTSGSDSRTCTITSGNLSQASTTLSLSFALNKIDDGIEASEEGTYIYHLNVVD